MTDEPAVVLLSGGQDSTTCLFWARARFRDVHALAFNYGQRHRTELEAASAIAELADASFDVLELRVLAELADSALVDPSRSLEASGGRVDAQAPEGLPTSFVPGRNLVFLSVAAAYAVKRGSRNLVTGVCEADCSGYPDCRQSFVEAMQEAVNRAMPSSAGPVVIHAPLMHMDKSRVVRMAWEMGYECWAALGMSVTCYEGLRPGCGRCPACELRAAGFAVAGLDDPAETRP